MSGLNNKGFTAVELLVTFVILSFVVTGMFDVALNYKDKEQHESLKSSIMDYESKIQKVIQDDLIIDHLVSVRIPKNNTTDKLSASFGINNPETNVKYTTNLVIDLTSNKISYGKSGEEVTYSLPEIDNLTINKDKTSIEQLGDEGTFIKINISLSHPDFTDDELTFSITAPVNFPINLDNKNILKGEVTLNDSNTFNVIGQTTYDYLVSSDDEYVKVKIKNTSDTGLFYSFYYYTNSIDTTNSNVSTGYLTSDLSSIPFSSGIMIPAGTKYQDFYINISGLKDKTIKLGVAISTVSNGISKTGISLFEKIDNLAKIIKFRGMISDVLNEDSGQTFLSGNIQNNYIWYSGHLWRAVSIDNSTNALKIITAQAETFISYGSLTAEGLPANNANITKWLGNFYNELRNADSFILSTNYNYTTYSGSGDLSSTNLSNRKIGLLNAYEYLMTVKNNTSFLNIPALAWKTQTPVANQNNTLYTVSNSTIAPSNINNLDGIRPVVVLNGSVKTSSGTGTLSSPYIVKDDSPTSYSAQDLVSGEYVEFSSVPNKRFRVVSKPTSSTIKVVATSLVRNYPYNTTDKMNSELYNYLNRDYYRTTIYSISKFINESNWDVTSFAANDFILTNNTTIKANVGFLQLGELLSGYCGSDDSDKCCLLLTPVPRTERVYAVRRKSIVSIDRNNDSCYVRPSFVLHTSQLRIKIGGSGTAQNPYKLVD